MPQTEDDKDTNKSGRKVHLLRARREDARYGSPVSQVIHKLIELGPYATAGTLDQSSSDDEFTEGQETTLQQKLEDTRKEAKRLAEGESLAFKASESCPYISLACL